MIKSSPETEKKNPYRLYYKKLYNDNNDYNLSSYKSLCDFNMNNLRIITENCLQVLESEFFELFNV